jgi:predicted esterase
MDSKKWVPFLLVIILIGGTGVGCTRQRFKGSPPASVAGTQQTESETPTIQSTDYPIASGTPSIPEMTGICPDFISGSVTFSPSGISPRTVVLWVGNTGGGPLVFWWHGAGGSAQNALIGLGRNVVSGITASGGVVASIEADPALSFGEWYLNTTDKKDDLLVADMVAACAVQENQIDPARIFVAGFSAGGKQAAQMAIRRSGYVAAVVVYSGGLFPSQLDPYPPYQDTANKFPSLVFWGGQSDVVLTDNTQAAHTYYNFVSENGNFTIMCDHNGGHTIPPEGQAAAWRFFQDHPWGITPEPYLTGMPSEIPGYCVPNL